MWNSRPLTLLARLRRQRALRYVGFCLALVAVILASAVVSTLTVDIGPYWRAAAEAEGSRRLNRPVHIGRLGIHLARGRVVAEDLSIDGRQPGDRPFFAAKLLSVSLDWSRAVQSRPEFVITSVELTDWQMLVERWSDGHSFPRFLTADRNTDAGPRRFTTTVRYLRAWRGEFSYLDHAAPWSVIAPNIDLNISNRPTYHGEATFTGGTIAIEDYVPMWANMQARFTIDGSRLHMDHVDLETDGARSTAHGEVDLGRWPEQTFSVESRVQFTRMRELFFASEHWTLSGEGDFDGTFHLFSGGHDLSGTFSSELAGVDAYRFPALHGALHWTRQGFQVTDARSDLYGGAARFSFSIAPLGASVRPSARFQADYAEVDLARLSDFYGLAGQRFAGRATGRGALEWPLGEFNQIRGEGSAVVIHPPGMQPMTPAASDDGDQVTQVSGPFGPQSLALYLPIGGEVTYRFDQTQLDVDSGVFATERTHVSFQGSTEWGERSRFQFHVTSRDWQESDQVLAGMLTDFGSPTRPVAFGGRGEFDGTMTGAFRRPRVEGTFTGQGVRAWDTLWGDGSARVVVENGYATIAGGIVQRGESEIRADGLFSLGYRRDGGEEIDARFRVVRRDIESLRHAFELDDYAVSGLLNGEFHLAGEYARPIGFGGMTVEEGVAYGQKFPSGAAALRFDGLGVRLDSINIRVVPDGSEAITGAAFVGWDGTYSFNVSASRIPIEQVAGLAFPRAQPTGLLEFSADGNGTFDVPQYDVRFSVQDLFVGDEGVGYMTGTLALRGTELSGQVDAASPRLAVTGTGRIAITPGGEADLTFRFHDTSLDPYVRLFVPRLSPFTTAVASGTIRAVGELANPEQLVVDGIIDSLDARLFDYAVRNAGPIRLALDRRVVRVDRLQLVGEDTQLTVGGSVDLANQLVALRASGDANLGILQGFFRDVRGSGRAELKAAIDGPLYEPLFSGSATITGGRVRHFSLPNSLDTINGTIEFDSRIVRFDNLEASMGGGRVQFGGRVEFDGYLPGELNVTARGEGIQLRYPKVYGRRLTPISPSVAVSRRRRLADPSSSGAPPGPDVSMRQGACSISAPQAVPRARRSLPLRQPSLCAST